MKRLKVLSVHLLVIFGLLILSVSSSVPVEEDQACYGTRDALQCSQHQLQCQNGTIIILEALRGFKQWSNGCNPRRRNCRSMSTCCRNTSQDCLEFYTQRSFSELVAQCWNKTNCTFTIPEAKRTTCHGNTYRYRSGYSILRHLCLPSSSILDFRSSSMLMGSELAVSYTWNAADWEQDIFCWVESADCRSHPVHALLMMSGHEDCDTTHPPVICLNETCIFCQRSLDYLPDLNTSTPFFLSITNAVEFDWATAVLRALDSTKMRVTCGLYEDNIPPDCSDESTAASTALLTTTSLSPGELTVSTDMAEVTSDITSWNPSTSADSQPSSPDSTGENMGQMADGSTSTGGIIGGAVAAVLALIAVAAVVIFVLVKRRRSVEKEASKAMTQFKGNNSRSPRHGKSATETSADAGKVLPDVTPEEPTSLSVYVNAAAVATAGLAGSCEDPGSDYDHLRQKPTSPAPRDVTYGHLVGSDDVTEYDYDHVVRGKPAIASGEVVNNVYDTARPGTAASSDDDHYNVTGAAGSGRHDVIGNDYDMLRQ